jgi:hypothetical protein
MLVCSPAVYRFVCNSALLTPHNDLKHPQAALKSAGVVVERLLEREKVNNNGVWPETIALVLWGTDNIKTYGESLAQVCVCVPVLHRCLRSICSVLVVLYRCPRSTCSMLVVLLKYTCLCSACSATLVLLRYTCLCLFSAARPWWLRLEKTGSRVVMGKKFHLHTQTHTCTYTPGHGDGGHQASG